MLEVINAQTTLGHVALTGSDWVMILFIGMFVLVLIREFGWIEAIDSMPLTPWGKR